MCFVLPEDPSNESGPAEAARPERPLQAEGVRGVSSLPELSEIRRLDGLIRAHVLLGFTEPRTSRGHQENLLRAYVFVLRTWNVRRIWLVTFDLCTLSLPSSFVS